MKLINPGKSRREYLEDIRETQVMGELVESNTLLADTEIITFASLHATCIRMTVRNCANVYYHDRMSNQFTVCIYIYNYNFLKRIFLAFFSLRKRLENLWNTEVNGLNIE